MLKFLEFLNEKTNNTYKDIKLVGVIYDNEGNLRCSENEIISDEMLLENFDWYVEGVEFYE